MTRSNAAVAAALRQVRNAQRWKPDRDIPHLRKRQRKKHLPAEASMETYNQIIQDLVHTPSGLTYHYPVGGHHYYAVRGKIDKKEWLVIFDASGVLETAFPPTDIDTYLDSHGFEYVGTIEKVLS